MALLDKDRKNGNIDTGACLCKARGDGPTGCDCQNRGDGTDTKDCLCKVRGDGPNGCKCQNRGGDIEVGCLCQDRDKVTDCVGKVGECKCDTRTDDTYDDSPKRNDCVCDSRVGEECFCQNRSSNVVETKKCKNDDTKICDCGEKQEDNKSLSINQKLDILSEAVHNILISIKEIRDVMGNG